MRKIFTLIVCLLTFNSIYAGSGTFEYYLNTLLNGSTTKNHGDYGGGTSFDGSALGTISSVSNTLVIDLVGLKTWQDNGSDVSSARLNYRVYKSGSTPPSTFTVVNLSFQGQSGNNKTWESGVDIDLLSGITDIGTYNVEVYFDASSTDGTLYRSNSGSNYTANFTVSVALPVELSTFKATQTSNAIALNWTTLSEDNNAGFDIEHSVNGKDFETIAYIEGAGNSMEQVDYSYLDENPTVGVNYYRLKQTDFDGTYDYSNIIAVEFDAKIEASIYPNPTSEQLTLRAAIQDMVNIRVVNINGQVVLQQSQYIDNQLDLNLNELPTGTYWLQVTNETNKVTLHNDIFVKE